MSLFYEIKFDGPINELLKFTREQIERVESRRSFLDTEGEVKTSMRYRIYGSQVLGLLSLTQEIVKRIGETSTWVDATKHHDGLISANQSRALGLTSKGYRLMDDLFQGLKNPGSVEAIVSCANLQERFSCSLESLRCPALSGEQTLARLVFAVLIAIQISNHLIANFRDLTGSAKFCYNDEFEGEHLPFFCQRLEERAGWFDQLQILQDILKNTLFPALA